MQDWSSSPSQASAQPILNNSSQWHKSSGIDHKSQNIME